MRTVTSNGYAISVLSGAPDQVSGGDARLRVELPPDADPSAVTLSLNGTDVTGSLAVTEDGALEGVVSGLQEGENDLVLERGGSEVASATLVNHPQRGPIFSGPHQEPFGCTAEEHGLTLVDEEDCVAEDRVDYVYRTTDGEFETFDPSAGTPDDVATTTTTEGDTVDYVVRWERGTINRFVYSIAMLAPDETDPGDPDRSAWNDRLIYKFQGGVGIGHSQGEPSREDMLLDVGLRQGYAVVYSTGTKTGLHYDLQVGGETALMVKEEFVERHGDPEYTVGLGGSGGAIQQYVYGQNHPDLIDAAIPVKSYPDMVTQTIHTGDCELLEYFMDVTDRDNPKWQDWDNRQWLEGLNSESDEPNPFTGSMGSSECINGWRGLTQLVLNPYFTDGAPGLDLDAELLQSVEWTHWADAKQIYGTNSAGFARRPWDNVGVQYGLTSLREGKITPEEFLTLNETIGGWKRTGEMVPPGQPWNPAAEETDVWGARNMNRPADGDPAPRTAGNVEAGRAAYESGLVFHGEIDVPIIDWRPYLEEELDMHNSHQSFAARRRIVDWKGHADNQVIWFVEPGGDLTERALSVMDDWMARIRETGGSPGAARPPEAADACFEADGSVIARGDDVWNGVFDAECQPDEGAYEDGGVDAVVPDRDDDGCGPCAEKFRVYSTSRILAGGPITGDVFKCHRMSVEEAIERGVYGDWDPTDEQRQRLEAAFPEGVCDYDRGDAARPDSLVGALTIEDYTGDDGAVSLTELKRAVSDFVTGEIDSDLLQRVVTRWARS
jgi:hypothetical protein